MTRPEPRQLPLYFNISFSLPPRPLLDRLDRWLALVSIGPDERRRVRLPASAASAVAMPWLSRALLLALELLRAARLPCFDPPRIVHCRAADSGGAAWKARVSLPLVEQVPRAVYERALQGSFDLCAWAAARRDADGEGDVFFGEIQKKVLDPLSKLFNQGQSTLPLLKGAYDRGVPFIHLGGGIYQLGWGSRGRLIDRSTTDGDAALGAKLAQNKIHSAHLLRSAGLPSPEQAVAITAAQALEGAKRLGWPVVVKPPDRDRGLGVTVDVADEAALEKAFVTAKNLSRSKQVIVERQVQGHCHRLFLVEGRLLYGISRLPMGVTGDGRNTIAALLAEELARQRLLPPWLRSKLAPLDDTARAALKAAGWEEQSVPPPGERVSLRRIESTEWGGVFEDVTDHIHRENRRIALEAAALFNLQVAGIDIITPDISRPWFENGAVINEVNFAPLLGGTEISRAYIPRFLEDLLGGDGRIPLEVFVGGEAAFAAARERQAELTGRGCACFLTSGVTTLDPSGTEWIMARNGEYHRTRALVLSRRVEALVLVVQSDEVLVRGVPLEAVDRVVVIDDRLVSASSPERRLTGEGLRKLMALLKGWAASPVREGEAGVTS